MVQSTCTACNLRLNRQDEKVFCTGGCNAAYHIKCVKMDSSLVDVNKWRCERCVKGCDSGISKSVLDFEVVLETLKILMKENADLKKAIVETNTKLDKQTTLVVKLLEKSEKLEPSNQELMKLVMSHQDKPTYAEKTKQSEEKLVIVPREGTIKNKIELKSAVMGNISPAELEIGISNVKPIRDGLLIACETKTERDKLKSEVETKLGREYEVKEVIKYQPKIKVIGIDNDMNEEMLEKCIRNQNSFMREAVIKVILIKKMKRNYMAIIEVDKSAFRAIIKEGKLKIGWSVCSAFESVDIRRCFKCLGFGHKADKCTNTVNCAKCGNQGHKENECNNDVSKNVSIALQLIRNSV